MTPKKSTRPFFSGWFPVAVGLACCITFVAVKWAVNKAVGWALLAWIYAIMVVQGLGIFFLGLFAAALLYSVVEWIVKSTIAVFHRRNASRYSGRPMVEMLDGIVAVRPLDAFYVRVFQEAYAKQMGEYPEGLSPGQLAELRSRVLPSLFAKPEVRAEYSEFLSQLYCLAQSNAELQAWVERCASSTRERKPFWAFFRLVKLVLRVVGWTEDQSYSVTTKADLLSDAKKFERLVLSPAGFMATPLFSRLLCPELPCRETPALRQAPSPTPRRAAHEVVPVPDGSDPVSERPVQEPEEEHEPSQPSSPPPTPANDALETKQALGALREGLRLDHGGWEAPARLLMEARLAAQEARELAPEEATTLLTQVEQLEARLSGFEGAYRAEQEQADVERFSPWFKRCLRELTESESNLETLEDRLALIASDGPLLERNAVRCFLFAAPGELARPAAESVEKPPELVSEAEVPEEPSTPPVVPVEPSTPTAVPAPLREPSSTPMDAATAAGFGS